MKKILIVAAHPDDEVLGCAGTVARLVKEGSQAFTLILGEGITARDDKRDVNLRNEEIKQLQLSAQRANKLLGVKEVFFCAFPDNQFDAVSLLTIVKKVEEIIQRVQPDIIFTHFKKDLNIDHQITAAAVLTATRPMVGQSIKEVYSFEILSSTEWNFPCEFSPNVFFDISSTIDIKVAALQEYQTEIRDFPHPRSAPGVRLNAQCWGMKTGVNFAEAFQIIRLMK